MRERKSTSALSVTTAFMWAMFSILVVGGLLIATQDHMVTSPLGPSRVGPLVPSTVFATSGSDFSVTANPSGLTVLAGAQGFSTISLNPINNFAGSVALSATVSPPATGMTFAFNPNSLSTPATPGTSTLTISTTASTPAQSYIVTVTGTNGTSSHTATIAVTVTADFTLSVNPAAVSIVATSSGTSTITASSLGLTGSVALSATVAPTATGLSVEAAPTTISLTPGSSGTSTLKITTTASTPSGTYTVTVTGTTGALTHTATVTLTVNADFTISASPITLTFVAGNSGTSTITANSLGFTGNVALSAAVSPTGIGFTTIVPTSVSLTPGTSPTATLTVTTATSTSAGTYTVTITGTSGTLSHTAMVTITVTSDFTIAASAASPASIVAGNSVTSTITLNSLGFTGSVALTAGVSPSATGAIAAFNPASVGLTPSASGTSILTFSTTASTLPGTYIITVTGSSGAQSHTATVTATVTADFTLVVGAATPARFIAGNSATSTITVGSLGFTGSVSLSATVSPPATTGMTFTFGPTAIALNTGFSGTSTLTIATLAETHAGNYTIALIGTSGILSHIATVTVTVGGNFTMTLAKSRLVVVEGGRAYTNLTLTSNGLSDAVSVYAVPPAMSSGLTGSFNPQLVQLTPGSVATTILTIDSNIQTIPGVYNITLVGQSNIFRIQRLIYLNLTVSDFSILINPNPISITPGQVGNTTVYVHGLFSFNGTINLVTYPLRQIQPSLLPNSIVLNSTSPLFNSTLTIRIQGSTLPGLYNIRVTGTVGRLVHTVILKLSVVEFSINITPSIILQVGQSLTTPLTITSQNGFTDTVDLNFTVPLDSGINGQISPPSVGLLPNATSSVTLTLTGSRPGAYRMNITGTSGIAHSFQYVTVYIGDFTISSSAPSIVIPIGAARTIQLDMGSHFFFSGNITLIVTSDPSGLDISNLGTVTVAPAKTTIITVTVSSAHATSGVYDLTMTGTNGRLSHTISLRVIVAAPPLLTVPALQTINQGSLLTFFVSATDSDSSLTISYTTLSPGATTTLPTLPPGATFYPSYRTNSTATTVTGIFNWKPSSSQMPGDYVITFTAQDRNGGVTSRQVTVHVNGAVNRSITLPSSPLVWYSLIAVIGIAGTLAGSRIWRNRNMRKASHEEDFHGALGIHGGTSKAEP